MLAICWCSELARHPGRAVLCQSLVKTLARAAFPMPGVSSGRLGMQPSALPGAEQGQGGLLLRTQRAVSLPLAHERGNKMAVRVPQQSVEEATEWAGRTMSRLSLPICDS